LSPCRNGAALRHPFVLSLTLDFADRVQRFSTPQGLRTVRKSYTLAEALVSIEPLKDTRERSHLLVRVVLSEGYRRRD
jgi:hypothetical protein